MSDRLFHEHELSRFLEQNKTHDSTNTTMTGMGTTLGKWKISDDKYTTFLDLLHDYLFVKRGTPLNFVEKPRKNEPKPLLIDLDFHYPEHHSLTRVFNLDMIEQFIHKIKDGLNYFFGLELYSELRFFVTLRSGPYPAKGKRKDGVHILCPDIALANEKQAVLRKWLLANEAIKVCFKDTGYTNSDDVVYDESMTRQQGWIFYGESKPNIPPYTLVAVFNYKPDEDDWIDEDISQYSSRDLIELLSVRYNIVPDENVLKEGAPVSVYTDLLHRPANVTVTTQATQEQVEAASKARDLANALNTFAIKPASEEEREMVRRFVLECLKPTWHDEYDKWIRVGWCLHNIDASEEYFTLWKDFSAKSGKSSENDWVKLRHEWFHGMRKSGDGPRLTQRSLQKWARDDNPELYKQIVADNIHEYIRTEVEPTHFHISKLMKKMYGNNYVASVHQRNTDWFKYDEDINMWKRLNQGLELKSKISCEVAGEIGVARLLIQKRIGECSAKDESTRNWLTEKMKELLKVETQLYNNGFTESVMKMASQQFCEEEFTNKLNANPYLLGCRNGVLELRVKCDNPAKHVIFRQGRPEDYVSFLAGVRYPDLESINYIPYEPSHPIQEEIQEFFQKLFPNSELKTYVLRLLSSMLEGTNKEQCYYTFRGRGSNGKSKIAELMEMTLGDYFTTMSSTVLTRKRPDAGAANPEIMAAKGRRFICLTEPDDKEPINTSRMKQFSGEDMVEARPLYGDQERFRIMGKICMLCNDLPAVNSMDHGTWRRIRVIPFEARFLDKGNPELLLNKPNIYEKDLGLIDKLIKWREQFLSLLVHIYETEYIPHGLNPVPEIVIRESNKYKEKFDVYARFKSERIREPVTAEEQLESRTNPLESKRVRLIIGQWKKENRIEGFTANDALDRMKDEFGEPEAGRFWPTIRMFTNDEDIAEWDKAHTTP